MKFKRNLVKFMAAATFFSAGITAISNVPAVNQEVQAAPVSKKRAAVANMAKKQVGKAYVYGATGPSAFDCSGLAQYVY